VALEVLTVDEARQYLRLAKPAEKARDDAAQADVERLYARNRKKTGRGPDGQGR
jgi:hypothetical protein